MGTLNEKIAIVTGSGRGIGQAIALKLASEGAKIVVNDLDAGPAAETVAKIKALGSVAIACNGNVADPDFGDRIVATAVDNFGGLDIIINNAGYPWDAMVHKTTDEQFQTMLDIHTVAPFRIIRAAATRIREWAKQEKQSGGIKSRKVVNVSSISGVCGNAGQSSYAAGKSALFGLTKTVGKELGRLNVTVNCVAFGLIETRMTQTKGSGDEVAEIMGRQVHMGIPEESKNAMKSMIPMGRSGTAEEAAGAAYLFCLPESDYITGQVVVASGGLML